MPHASRIRSILALAIVLIGFVLWSVSAAAQGGSQAPTIAGPAVPEPSRSTSLEDADLAEAPTRGSAHEYLRAGDEAFAAADFAAAELEYRRAAEREPSFRASYNLGVALARQQRHEEAAEAFAVARRLTSPEDAAATVDAAYNAGTAAATTEELEASVAAYTDALQADPHDREAKENLAQVLKKLRQQREQEQQRQQRGEGESEEREQDSEEEPEPGEQPTPPEEQGTSGEENGPDSEEEQQPEPRASEPTQEEAPTSGEDGQPGEPQADVEREEADRLLNLARELERETQERLKLGERTRARPEKDW